MGGRVREDDVELGHEDSWELSIKMGEGSRREAFPVVGSACAKAQRYGSNMCVGGTGCGEWRSRCA